VERIQLVQEDALKVEVRIVSAAELSTRQSQWLLEYVAKKTGLGRGVAIIRVDSIERHPSGKYETVISRLST
jgi:F0F1-type ATP synthase delta subunit